MENNELHTGIIAAVRNPDNSDRLIQTPVKLLGYDTTAVCWLEEENGEPKIQPMLIVVTPEIFELIKHIEK